MSVGLIPLELAWLGLSRTHLAWMEKVGTHDATGLLTSLLEWSLRHPTLTNSLVWSLVGAQALLPLLALKVTLERKRRRYPWSHAWEHRRNPREDVTSILRRGGDGCESHRMISNYYCVPGVGAG